MLWGGKCEKIRRGLILARDLPVADVMPRCGRVPPKCGVETNGATSRSAPLVSISGMDPSVSFNRQLPPTVDSNHLVSGLPVHLARQTPVYRSLERIDPWRIGLGVCRLSR